MKLACLPLFAACLSLCGCNSPPPQADLSPDGRAWVSLRELQPDPAKEQLLPTKQLVLAGRGLHSPLVLLEDAESLCGVQVAWLDAGHLLLRAPMALASLVKVANGKAWGAVSLQVDLHQDAVRQQRWSEDGRYGLIVIGNCEQTAWNLYLRRQGEPLFNEAMRHGWDDPDVFGGFSWDQSVAALDWTGPRRARVRVHGSRHQVTVRDRIGEIELQWVFTDKEASTPRAQGRPLPFIKAIPAANR